MRKSGSAAVGSRALHFDIFAHQFKDYVHHGKFLSAFIFRKAIGLGEFLDAFRFIDQDDYLAAGSSLGGLNHISETDTRNVRAVFAAIFLFPFTQRVVEGLGDHVHLILSPSAEVQMQHWIFNPVLLQRGDRQSVKEFLFPLEICLHR